MASKAIRVWSEFGTVGLLARARRKLERPTLPIAALGEPVAQRLQFECRRVQTDGGLCEHHSVTVIVLTKGNQSLLNACLTSLFRSVSSRALLDVIVITNGGLVHAPEWFPFPVEILSETRPFNWSVYNNIGASRASGEFLLFLNDDIQALHEGWLDAMLSVAMTPRAGAVGAKLLYPEGMVQHVGIELGLGGEAGHPYKFDRRGDCQERIRYTDAVTGACLLTRRSLFQAVGGLDVHLAYDYNDVDYCLRLGEGGWQTLVSMEAELIHLETATRPLRVLESEKRYFRQRWSSALQRKLRS